MNVLGSRRGQRNIGDDICQTIGVAGEKQDHKRPFIIWQTGLLVEEKREKGKLGAAMRLIIIMEQQQAPLTVGSNIMLK